MSAETGGMHGSYCSLLCQAQLKQHFACCPACCTGRSLLVVLLQGHVKVLGILLDHGADINARSSDGYKTLSQAAKTDSVDAVKLLIAKGANPKGHDESGKCGYSSGDQL